MKCEAGKKIQFSGKYFEKTGGIKIETKRKYSSPYTICTNSKSLSTLKCVGVCEIA